MPSTTATAGRGGTVVAILAVAAGSWGIAIWRMRGMDMGTATALGSLGSFVTVWVPMMAAMMLPGAVPAVLRRPDGGAHLGRAAVFVGSYLGVWFVAGIVLYGLYRPHGTAVAGAVVLAAAVYELTPIKRHWRRRCREKTDSGLAFGAACVGSSLGLMAMMAALGVMSITWMAVIAAAVFGQKALDATPITDLPLVLALLVLGVLILVDPSAVPGLTPAM